MTQLVGLKEFRSNIEKYASQTQEGRSFVVLKRNKPIFKVVSTDDTIDLTEIKKGGVSVDFILKALRQVEIEEEKTRAGRSTPRGQN